MAAGVLFAPGAQFNLDGRSSSGLRLTFALADEDAIRRGVASLGAVVKGRLAGRPRRAAAVHV